MNVLREIPTQSRLLHGARDLGNQGAWHSLFRQYDRPILEECRRLALTPQAAEEVAANVWGRLVSLLPRFTYDRSKGSFRGLLRVLIRHGVADYFQDLDKTPGLPCSGNRDAFDLLHRALAAEDDQDCLQKQEVELLHTLELLHEAMKRVQARVQLATWDVFTRTVLEGMSDREVAREFGMERNAVNQIRFRVTQRIKRAFTDLRNGAEPPVEPQEQVS